MSALFLKLKLNVQIEKNANVCVKDVSLSTSILWQMMRNLHYKCCEESELGTIIEPIYSEIDDVQSSHTASYVGKTVHFLFEIL